MCLSIKSVKVGKRHNSDKIIFFLYILQKLIRRSIHHSQWPFKTLAQIFFEVSCSQDFIRSHRLTTLELKKEYNSGVASLAEKKKKKNETRSRPKGHALTWVKLPLHTVFTFRYRDTLSTYYTCPKNWTFILLPLDVSKHCCIYDPDPMTHYVCKACMSQYLGFITVIADAVQHSTSIATATRSQIWPCL